MKLLKLSVALVTTIAVSLYGSLAGGGEQNRSNLKEAVYSILLDADISTIHSLLKKGYLTCRELTEFYLERIETYNGEYNCFITLCSDALEQADIRDEYISTGADFGVFFRRSDRC